MTLRKRLFFLAAPLLLLTLVLVHGLAQTQLLTSFDSNDEHLLEGEANAMAMQLDSFITRSLDILQVSAWSDSLLEALRTGRGQDFTIPNFDLESVRNQDFNFMMYFDNHGNLLGERWISSRDNELRRGPTQPTLAEMREGVLERARHLGMLNPQSSPMHSSAQMVMIHGVPVVLLGTPISNSAGTAAPAGNAIAGRFLSLHRQELLSRFITGDLRFLPPDAHDTRHWQLIPGHKFLRTTNFHVDDRQISDRNHQEIDLRMLNSLGEPEMLIQISQPRLFFQSGKHTITFFLQLVALVAVAALVLGYTGLELWILQRVARLNRQVASIGPDSALPRLPVRGNDEISQLAGELNGMLERLAQSEDRGQVVLDSISDGYLEVDMFDRIGKANRSLHSMLGYPPEGLVGVHFSALFAACEDLPGPMQLRQQLLEREQLSFKAPLKCHDGSLRWFDASFSLIRSGNNAVLGFRGILRDISEQMAYQNQLLDMAYRDALTGLGNRKAFNEKLEHALAIANGTAETTAVLFIDLDHFKEVNDRYGHHIGDQLLISVADRLRNSLRQPDLPFRLGGDEFTVLLRKADEHQAMALGERLLTVLGEDYLLGDIRIDVISPSIGVALHPTHAGNAADLTKAADAAMYHAKRRRNCCCLYQAETSKDAEEADRRAREATRQI